MKNEIPPSSTIAPIAMITAVEPLSPLPPLVDEVVVGATSGAGVEVVGAGALGTGSPGVNGFDGPPCASVAPGAASISPTINAAIRRRTGSYASGCSIAGVSGASR